MSDNKKGSLKSRGARKRDGNRGLWRWRGDWENLGKGETWRQKNVMWEKHKWKAQSQTQYEYQYDSAFNGQNRTKQHFCMYYHACTMHNWFGFVILQGGTDYCVRQDPPSPSSLSARKPPDLEVSKKSWPLILIHKLKRLRIEHVNVNAL